ncbi:MAG: guanylate kinase [Lachnospiraceae bacterium]|nr:guanylate kinase [Lachnospiraceae bacterium]
MGKIFYIMGKSATGKDHIYGELLQDPELKLKPLVLYTTRPIRSGETEGETYYFSDEQHLKQLTAEGKIIEVRCYQTIHGPWYYFTADEGQFDTEQDILGIGTLESYSELRSYFGEERIVPLYIEVEDGLRLKRAIGREEQQEQPKYQELCRRFLADSQDFSEEKILEQGIEERIHNNGTLEECLERVRQVIRRHR